MCVKVNKRKPVLFIKAAVAASWLLWCPFTRSEGGGPRVCAAAGIQHIGEDDGRRLVPGVIFISVA